LTFKQDVDDGHIVAIPDGPFSGNDDLAAWQSATHFPLTAADQSGDISWSSDGEKVVFSSERSGPPGIYTVDDWSNWLAAGASYSQQELVVNDFRNDWARFRPGH
jgi:hypothetical protein